MTARHAALPPSLAPRGLSRREAAAYIGIGTTKFDELIASGLMPRPKIIGERRVWDREALDTAFAALPDETGARTPAPESGDPWDRARV